MKLCSACCHELPQESFSKKQWQLKQYQRRCRGCIDVNRVVQLKAPPKNESTEVPDRQSPCNDNNGGVSCWICLEEGPDESGQPLGRDCSCRGESAGFGHLSCIVQYAGQKSEDWDGRYLSKFSEPWKVCHSCHQVHQNELAVDLATEFVTFVDGKYPGHRWKQLEALHLMLEVLMRMATRLQPKQKERAKKIASKMLSMIGEMKTLNPSQTKRILQTEALVYDHLGRIALMEGTEESAKAAVEYCEKYRDISKVIGFVEGAAIAESNIALAKSEYGGGNNVSNEENLEKRQKLYKECVEKFGEHDETTITTGLNLSIALEKADRVIEAERLLTKLASTSKRVHGQDHRLTKLAASDLKKIKFFHALRYDGDGKECTEQGPITKPRNTQDERTFTVAVATEEIYPVLGTHVVCHGLENAPHLNGKIGDLRSLANEQLGRYRVHVEVKGLESCSVKRENIRILLELPDD